MSVSEVKKFSIILDEAGARRNFSGHFSVQYLGDLYPPAVFKQYDFRGSEQFLEVAARLMNSNPYLSATIIEKYGLDPESSLRLQVNKLLEAIKEDGVGTQKKEKISEIASLINNENNKLERISYSPRTVALVSGEKEYKVLDFVIPTDNGKKISSISYGSYEEMNLIINKVLELVEDKDKYRDLLLNNELNPNVSVKINAGYLSSAVISQEENRGIRKKY